MKRKYQEAVHRKLTPLVGNSPIAANARYQQIKIALTEAANEVLPRAPSRIRGKLRRFDDVVIDRLSNRQLNLTESIYNRSRNQQKNKRLRRKRSRIFKQIPHSFIRAPSHWLIDWVSMSKWMGEWVNGRVSGWRNGWVIGVGRWSHSGFW